MKGRIRARWARTILVCAKCEKKLDGGFGSEGRQALSKCLATRNGGGRRRTARIGVLAVKCLKVCPKGAVTVVDAERPRDWLLVSAGTPLAQVEAALGLGAEGPASGT